MSMKKKINDHGHDKFNTTSELKILATNVVNTKITEAKLITKTDLDIKVSSI